LFREHRIRATPTSVIFKNGQELSRKAGFMPAAEFEEWVRQTCEPSS
jgi:hypothetical protein